MISFGMAVVLCIIVGILVGFLIFYVSKKCELDLALDYGVIFAIIISASLIGIVGMLPQVKAYKTEVKDINECKVTADGTLIVTFDDGDNDEYNSSEITYKVEDTERVYLTIEHRTLNNKLILTTNENNMNKIRGITNVEIE